MASGAAESMREAEEISGNKPMYDDEPKKPANDVTMPHLLKIISDFKENRQWERLMTRTTDQP